MKREVAIFRQRFFTALSVLSLLLCVATLGLWVRSYWRIDEIRRTRALTTKLPSYLVQNESGGIYFATGLLTSSNQHAEWSYHSHAAPEGLEYVVVLTRRFMGFGSGYGVAAAADPVLRAIGIPHWFLALLFAILPALHLRAAIRSRRRHRAGHCPRCGYDLRATPERCPECGTERVLATNEHE